MATSDRWERERNAGGRSRAAAADARRANRQHDLSQRIQQIHHDYQDVREKLREIAMRKREVLSEIHDVQDQQAAAAKASDQARNEVRMREKKLEREIEQREALEQRALSRVAQLREELDKVKGPGSAQQFDAERAAAQFDLEEEISKERHTQQVLNAKLDELVHGTPVKAPAAGAPRARGPVPASGPAYDGHESPAPAYGAVMASSPHAGYALTVQTAYPTASIPPGGIPSFSPPSIPPAYTPLATSPVPTARSGLPIPNSTRVSVVGPTPRAEVVRYVSPVLAPSMIVPGLGTFLSPA